MADPISNVSYAPAEAPTTPSTLPDALPVSGGDAGAGQPPAPVAPAPQGGSRLGAILGAVAKTASTALQGIPNQGRPSFATGLGAGARAEQAEQDRQQAIKFKDFDTQVRLAELHHQDIKMQNDTQEQRDAHVKAEISNRALANDYGIDYDTIANHGPAVMDHLAAQTAANGAASVPAGTYVSGDGQNVYLPKDPDSQKTRDAQKQMYGALAPALGLPGVPQGADFVPPKLMNMLTNKLQGFGLDGTPIKHDDLPGLIGAEQQQREQFAKNGATPQQLKALDGMIAIHQANLKALDTHASDIKEQSKQAELNAETSPESITGAANKAKAVAEATLPSKLQLASAKQAQKDASDKNMYVGSDAKGNQVAGTQQELTAAGASGITKAGEDTSKKVIVARQLISPDGLFSLIRQDMDALDKKGKMGSAATARFNDALLSKAGTDPDYAPLFNHTHLLATALMQAHVGSKGSTDMMEEFKSLANAGKMSAATLRSSLGAEYKYVHEKAMLPKKEQP